MAILQLAKLGRVYITLELHAMPIKQAKTYVSTLFKISGVGITTIVRRQSDGLWSLMDDGGIQAAEAVGIIL